MLIDTAGGARLVLHHGLGRLLLASAMCAAATLTVRRIPRAA
ncbi:hypothetical protein [Streptomyces sp. NPDC097610]